MTVQVNVAGVNTVSVDTGTSNALEALGVPLDTPSITDRSFELDVHGDAHGGPDGPPIDVQFLGRVIDVRIEFSTYDRAVLNKIYSRLNGGSGDETTVATADIGDLYFQESRSFRVLINNANDPRNYLRCIFRNPIEVGVGTKFSRLVIDFTAYRNASGVLYNTTTS